MDDNDGYYRVVHNNIYPNFDSISIVNSTGTVVKNTETLTIDTGATALIKIPVVDSNVNLIAKDYYDDVSDMLKILDTKFTLKSDKAIQVSGNNTLLTERIYNLDNNTIIDYIRDDNNDFSDDNAEDFFDIR
jgi:hypothetical protein